jgi:hypothetical protein
MYDVCLVKQLVKHDRRGRLCCQEKGYRNHKEAERLTISYQWMKGHSKSMLEYSAKIFIALYVAFPWRNKTYV